MEELGPKSIEELGDKRANFEVVMVDEVVPLVYVVCSWRNFDIEATDVVEPKSLENLVEKPPSGQ